MAKGQKKNALTGVSCILIVLSDEGGGGSDM